MLQAETFLVVAHFLRAYEFIFRGFNGIRYLSRGFVAWNRRKETGYRVNNFEQVIFYFLNISGNVILRIR